MASHSRNTSTHDQPLYTELLRGFTIRLIELEEGEPDSEISIRLLIAELDFAPQFEALSYVWGNPDPTKRTPITCNGRQLNVTRNLHAALRRIRYTDRPRILWVDAICINQRNNKECSYHVSFMNKIYEKAKRVIVFMGQDTDGRGEEVKNLVKEHLDRMSGEPGYKSVNEMPILSPDDPTFADTRWKALATLMDVDWFSRAWVLQEVGVAKLPWVIYGKSEFNYRHLMQLSRWVVRCAQTLQGKASINFRAIHTEWEEWKRDWRETSDSPEHDLYDISCTMYCR
jgi:heterokaryon incompatibility protein (HET)